MNKIISCKKNYSVALLSNGTIKCWDIIKPINVIKFIKLLRM